MATLNDLIHSTGDEDAIANRASTLLSIIVATARWEVGQGAHPLYKHAAEWTGAEYRVGREAAEKKVLSRDRMLKRGYPMLAVKKVASLDSDGEDPRDNPSSQERAKNNTCKRRRVGDINAVASSGAPSGAVMATAEDSDGWASDDLIIVSSQRAHSPWTPNSREAAPPTPDTCTSQESGGAALSPTEGDARWEAGYYHF